MSAVRDDFDSPWKAILDPYYPECLAFFFPQIAADIDWSKGYTFLDKELQEMAPDGVEGRRYVDKLVQVYRKNGEQKWVYSHLEVQGQPENSFTRRMYIYRYRCGDHYGVNISSVAILCDTDPDWRPNQYHEELWGSKVTFEFPIVKLLDYADQWEELAANDNPFATVVMAHLKTLETKNDEKARKQWKFWLTRRLYERGYSRQDIINLYRFIDWIMQLPKDLNREFKQEVLLYEEAKRMHYITSIEQLALEEGYDKGLQVAQRLLVKLLHHRFGTIEPRMVESLQHLSAAHLELLTDVALTIPSLAAFANQVTQLVAISTAAEDEQ